MTSSGEDADSRARAQYLGSPLDLHHYLAGENVEKLLRPLVVVAHLAGAAGNELFNHTEVLILDEMPAVAIVSPTVVLGVLAAHGTGLGGIFRHAFPLS